MPESINAVLQRFGSARVLVLAVVAVAAIALIWLLASWGSKPALVPLMATTDIASVGQITAQLDEAGITYQLAKGGGEVDVAEADLARARVLLAKEGIPARGRPGFELFDKPTWGMTDFTQRINYRRALEGELERTIRQMRGVEAAEVHLALPQDNDFKTDTQPEAASVVLTLADAQRPSDELVEGITSLVASSVDGLASDRVTVLDDTGRLLSQATEAGQADGLTKKQLALRRDVESYLEERAEDLVGEIVGTGNVRVRVAAEMNFDHLDRTTQRINPDEQVTTKEEKSQITPAPGQVAAGSSQTSATYDASRTTETFSSAAGNVKRITVAVLVNEKSAAANPEGLTKVEMLVRNAVGIDANRGDAISVVSTPFTIPAAPKAKAPEETAPLWTRMQPLQKPAVILVALLLTFGLARQALAALRPVQRVPQRGQLSLAEPATEYMSNAVEPSSRVDAAQVHAALKQPEMTARVLRTWIKES